MFPNVYFFFKRKEVTNFILPSLFRTRIATLAVIYMPTKLYYSIDSKCPESVRRVITCARESKSFSLLANNFSSKILHFYPKNKSINKVMLGKLRKCCEFSGWKQSAAHNNKKKITTVILFFLIHVIAAIICLFYS